MAVLVFSNRRDQLGQLDWTLNVATAYFHGLGVPQSYDSTAKWLQLLAARGDPRAEHRLALLYTEGVGVPQNPEIAVALFRRAAAQGYAPAMAIVGALDAEGSGTKRDDARAAAVTASSVRERTR
ncbi:MAG: tetratricopeptide repeat protein [Steroidobacteraceae bacterium]